MNISELDNYLENLSISFEQSLFRKFENHFGKLNINAYFKKEDGVYQWMNKYQINALGYENASNTIGKTVFELLEEEYASNIDTNDFAVMDKGQIQTFLEPVMIINSEVRYYMFSIKKPLITQNGNLLGMFGLSFRKVPEKSELKKTLLQASLSNQQSECLMLLVRGYSASQIGDNLHLSKRTVESYVEIIKSKFGCNTKQELIDYTLSLFFEF